MSGQYLLVKELEQSLRKATPSRVVNLASSLASYYDPNEVEFRTRKYDGFKVYAQSKPAVRMLTWWQAKQLEGAGVTVNAVDPGFVRTDFKLSAPLFAITNGRHNWVDSTENMPLIINGTSGIGLEPKRLGAGARLDQAFVAGSYA